MFRALRLMLAFAISAAMLGSGAAAAQAASAAQPGASCNNTSSAINQYCEDLPSASGGSPPPGTPMPALGATLPLSAVRAYNHLPAKARKRARKLLSLPAPAASVRVNASISTHKSAWSLPFWIVLAIIAIAAACLAAVARRRRDRTGPATEA